MKKLISQILFAAKCFFSKNAELLENANLIEHVDDELEKSKQTLEKNVTTTAKFLLTLNKTKDMLQAKKDELEKNKKLYAACIKEIKEQNTNESVSKSRELAGSCLKKIKTLEFEIENLQSMVDSLKQKYDEMVASLKELKKGIDARAIEVECLKSQNSLVELKKSISNEFDVKFEDGSCSQYYNKLKDRIKLTMNEMDIKHDLGSFADAADEVAVDFDINAKIDEDVANA